jgi:hypothetical protein
MLPMLLHTRHLAAAAAAAVILPAGLTQLRAVQLSVDGGFNAAHAAFHWGVGVGQQGAGSSSSIGAIGKSTLTCIYMSLFIIAGFRV